MLHIKRSRFNALIPLQTLMFPFAISAWFNPPLMQLGSMTLVWLALQAFIHLGVNSEPVEVKRKRRK